MRFVPEIFMKMEQPQAKLTMIESWVDMILQKAEAASKARARRLLALSKKAPA